MVQLHVRYKEPPHHIGRRLRHPIDAIALGAKLQLFAATTRAPGSAMRIEDRRVAHGAKMVLYLYFRNLGLTY
jgi:hypothetical protein